MRSASGVPTSTAQSVPLLTGRSAADTPRAPGPRRPGRRDTPHSLWSIVDADGCMSASIPEDDADVRRIVGVAARWTAEIDSRHWYSVEDALDREWTHCSAAFGESPGDAYRAAVRDYDVRNRIDTQPQLPVWCTSALTGDRATAVVSLPGRTTLVAAAPPFRGSSGLHLGDGLVEPRRLTLSRSDGMWLITSVERRPATRVARTAP